MVHKNPLETSSFPIMHETMYIKIHPQDKISKTILSKLFVFPPVCNKTMSYVQEFKLTKCVPPPPPPPPPSFYEDTQKRSKLKSRPNSQTTPAQPAAATTRGINNKRLMCICMNI